MALRRSPADPRTWLHRLHLAQCRECREMAARAEAEVLNLFAPYARSMNDLLLGEEASRHRLLAGIRAAERQSRQAKGLSGSPSRWAIAAAGALAASACALFLFVSPVRRTAMTADSLLTQATSIETGPVHLQRTGVVFQRVELRSRSQRIEWPVYRDVERRRAPHYRPLSKSANALAAKLENAGIRRDDPLSASSFKLWHDRLQIHTDSVARSPSGLITITTVLPVSAINTISQETLTLRASDLHPIERTVAFSDSETVEIAELEYHVLNLNEVPKDWFDGSVEPLRLPVHTSVSSLPAFAPALTESQLNLAELQARLVLSRENADASEQIELSRQPSGVLVSGLASSIDRKQKLQAALAPLPNVIAHLTTAEERAANSEAHPAPTLSVKLVESVSRPSPLLLYWRLKQQPPDQFPVVTGKLLESTLRIRQQSHALKELMHEFAGRLATDDRSRETQEAYETLWREHVSKLRSAVAEQRTLLETLAHTTTSAMPVSSLPSAETGSGIEALDRAATDSMQLCRELTAGDGPEHNGQRDAPTILTDLTRQSLLLSAITNRLQAQ